MLPENEAEDFFLALGAPTRPSCCSAAGRGAAPVDAPARPGRRGGRDPGRAGDERERTLLALLDDADARARCSALLAYAEDDAGGLMNPRFARAARRT